MSLLRSLLFIGFLSAQIPQALALSSHCHALYITNNGEQALEISGVYPDSEEVLQTIIIKPDTAQQSISLATVRTCGGNTSQLHCNAMWIACHNTIHLTVRTVDTGLILLSGLVQANDTLSFR